MLLLQSHKRTNRSGARLFPSPTSLSISELWQSIYRLREHAIPQLGRLINLDVGAALEVFGAFAGELAVL